MSYPWERAGNTPAARGEGESAAVGPKGTGHKAQPDQNAAAAKPKATEAMQQNIRNVQHVLRARKLRGNAVLSGSDTLAARTTGKVAAERKSPAGMSNVAARTDYSSNAQVSAFALQAAVPFAALGPDSTRESWSSRMQASMDDIDGMYGEILVVPDVNVFSGAQDEQGSTCADFALRDFDAAVNARNVKAAQLAIADMEEEGVDFVDVARATQKLEKLQEEMKRSPDEAKNMVKPVARAPLVDGRPPRAPFVPEQAYPVSAEKFAVKGCNIVAAPQRCVSTGGIAPTPVLPQDLARRDSALDYLLPDSGTPRCTFEARGNNARPSVSLPTNVKGRPVFGYFVAPGQARLVAPPIISEMGRPASSPVVIGAMRPSFEPRLNPSSRIVDAVTKQHCNV